MPKPFLPIPRIVRAYGRPDAHLRVVFVDGSDGIVDLRQLLPPTRIVRLQASGQLELPRIDQAAGTVCWSDGSDISPERARELLQPLQQEEAPPAGT
jgi:hypothetical protein